MRKKRIILPFVETLTSQRVSALCVSVSFFTAGTGHRLLPVYRDIPKG